MRPADPAIGLRLQCWASTRAVIERWGVQGSRIAYRNFPASTIRRLQDESTQRGDIVVRSYRAVRGRNNGSVLVTLPASKADVTTVGARVVVPVDDHALVRSA